MKKVVRSLLRRFKNKKSNGSKLNSERDIICMCKTDINNVDMFISKIDASTFINVLKNN